jgi:thiol:disulfide interchange protein
MLIVIVCTGLILYCYRRFVEHESSSPAVHAQTSQIPAKPPATPYSKRHLYSETDDPKALIAAGIQQAKTEHKRVILDFGGDWCGDCQVLDIYLHQQPNWDLLNRNFVIVHVFIGHIDKNLDIPEGYGVAIHKGVPALAVLDSNGKVLYAQKSGEFEDMRHMDAKSVTDFLNRWKT